VDSRRAGVDERNLFAAQCVFISLEKYTRISV
jgi:hypothetical protein